MPNTYTLLETITVGAAGASSVTFNSIPQTGYTDLVLKISSRQNADTNAVMLSFTFNGNTTGYSRKNIYTDGTGIGNLTGTSEALSRFAFSNSSTFTANTFTNAELYIPNYTSSNAKSVSADGVAENNATLGYVSLSANLWSPVTQAPISSISIGISSGGSSFAQHSTFSLYGVSALGVIPTKAPKATGGSIIQTDGTYWYHAFLSSGTFTPATALTCDYLVVAGGGGGAAWGGGGGAGGLRSTVTATGGGGSLESALSLASGTAYTVTIGAGGAGANYSSPQYNGNNGSNSVFSTITSTAGGGGGGYAAAANGKTGGSGGGGASQGGGSAGGAGTTNQGFAGGTGQSGGNLCGGAGGGAGAVGANGVNGGATGGAGVAISALATATGTGVSSYYAGGGGGSGQSTAVGTGGAGGGGSGVTNASATAGTANTGSGGGGGYSQAGVADYNGGNGGSGIVIIRYLA
jgi:hypothetical protein